MKQETTNLKDENKEELSAIQLLAREHAKRDKEYTSGYSINPLDDGDDYDL